MVDNSLSDLFYMLCRTGAVQMVNGHVYNVAASKYIEYIICASICLTNDYKEMSACFHMFNQRPLSRFYM